MKEKELKKEKKRVREKVQKYSVGLNSVWF